MSSINVRNECEWSLLVAKSLVVSFILISKNEKINVLKRTLIGQLAVSEEVSQALFNNEPIDSPIEKIVLLNNLATVGGVFLKKQEYAIRQQINCLYESALTQLSIDEINTVNTNAQIITRYWK